ncbi:MAG: serine/threonine-protein kinase [Pseudomonadota bacterium]
MSETRWERLQSLFEQAVKLHGDDREKFLSTACGDDTDLRRELHALLQADSMESGGASRFALDKDYDDELVGTTIDAWKLVELIGTGGMGSVFLAQRVDGSYEQDVALKIVRKGVDTESVVRRFEMERQILARLEHPNIARLIDGGVTGDGRPYLAMEYVDGLPITEYCDRNQLTVEKRVALFQVACNAVHYAHRSLIVHRDLKPSNIIVTADGTPKLLDFGIAKLLDDTEDPQLTRTGRQLHTPAYAAPEQLMSGPITTATDVYALGVILYELLSGRRPFEVRRTPQEFRELVLADGPARPSTAITQLPADTHGRTQTTAPETVGRLRRTPVDRLRRQLKGDLDTICLMALKKEPEERYASADQVAADLGRHLDGLPVVARPDSIAYRVGKFVRRHRLGTGMTAAVVIAFIGLSSFYTAELAAERDLALDEQRKANEVVNFVTGLFTVSNPDEARGERISARELLDAGAAQIRTELTGRPSVQATMMRVLGEVYQSLGLPDQAEALVADALERQIDMYGERHAEVATSRLVLGLLYQDASRYDEALLLLDQALATRRELFGEPHREVMEALSARAYFEETVGNYPEAERLHEETLAMGRALFPDDDEFLAEAMVKLAGLYRILDRFDEAEPLLRDALVMQNRLYGGEHPESDSTKRQLAALLRDTDRLEESETLYKEVIASRTRMLGPDHIEVAHAWASYAQLLDEMGELDAAIEANQTFIGIVERIHDGPHPSLGAAYNNQAILLRDQGDYDGAVVFFQQSIDMQDAVGLALRHPNRSFPTAGMAEVLRRLERYGEAEPLLREALAIREESFDPGHRLILELRSTLGATLTGSGGYAEAETLLLNAYEGFLASRGEDYRGTRAAARRLSNLYERTGNDAGAERFRAAAGEER